MSRHHENVSATAILPTQDMDASAAFYSDLGFIIDRFTSDYAFVLHFGHEVLHLVTSESSHGAVVYLNVPDADSWHARCERSGHAPSAIEDRPWGMREFNVSDPSGNTLRIGTNR